MPYSSMDEVNPAIKGIDPSVTLAQANIIASWADKIEGVESPWAVALANFKKAYQVEGGKWVKRAAEADMGELSEAVTKKVSGKNLPASSFLVVGDSEEIGTWSLPVKDASGSPDHRLMGGAWAALHGGWRSKKYAGPNKAKAIAKLKALYKAEDMDVPAAESYQEDYGDNPEVLEKVGPEVPLSATTFADVDAQDKASVMAGEIRRRTDQFQQLVGNIMWDGEIGDKPAALRSLMDEFIALLGQAGIAEMAPLTEVHEATLAEAESGVILDLQEVNLDDGYRGGPLRLNVQVIKPGWGNPEDNHYYPAETLARDVHVFNGMKMYTTNHKPNEKNVRTEVSEVLDCPIGFTEDGAPLALVGIHNEDFARDVFNRARLGTLKNLHVSIMAKGKTRKGFEEDGRKGKYVEAITLGQGLDWVTRAGAGGHAVELVEGQEGSKMSDDKDKELEEQDQNETESGQAEEADLREGDQEPPVTDGGEITLEEAAAKAIVDKTRLPSFAKERLMAESYADEAELQEAVKAWTSFIKEQTGSGRAQHMGRHVAPEERGMSDEEYEEDIQGVLTRYVPATAAYMREASSSKRR